MTDDLMPVVEQQVRDVAQRLEEQLPGWRMDCALAFGSTVRGEAIDGSDVDLWFIGYSGDRLYLDRAWRQGRFAPSTKDFLAHHPRLKVIEIDSWGALGHQVGLRMPLVFGMPVADIRWALWQLGSECDWQTFFALATGRAVLESHGFLTALQGLLRREIPFHVHPDHGIVTELQQFCGAVKLSLLRDLVWVSGKDISPPKDEHRAWLWPAVQCIRDPLSLLTFLETGKPISHRQDVLRMVSERFPGSLQAAKQVYRYKATSKGREELAKLLGSDREAVRGALGPLTVQILDLWHAVMQQVDHCILEGKGKVPFAREGWQERNQRLYDQFLEQYQR